MSQCNAINRNGFQCKRAALPGSKYCWQHNATFFQSIIVVISVLFLFIGLWADLFSLGFLQENKNDGSVLVTKTEIDSIILELDLLKQEQQILREQIASLSEPTSDVALSSNVSKLEKSTKAIDERLEIIEDLIIQDPQKALEIPLIRKDIEHITESVNVKIDIINREIERFYNIVVVSFLTLAIGVLTPGIVNGITNMFRIERDEAKNQNTTYPSRSKETPSQAVETPAPVVESSASEIDSSSMENDLPKTDSSQEKDSNDTNSK
jgi:hypothetical protein